jgi:hypothetical protein
MPLTLNGDGTIAGLSVGGLPDGVINDADLASNAVTEAKLASSAVTEAKLASNAVTAAKIADATITPAKLNGAQSGSAPGYVARAWVNFDGSGTVSIRASGNVSSITDSGVGNYRVNFTTAFDDTNYAMAGCGQYVTGGSVNSPVVGFQSANQSPVITTSVCQVVLSSDAATPVDSTRVTVSFFR